MIVPYMTNCADCDISLKLLDDASFTRAKVVLDEKTHKAIVICNVCAKERLYLLNKEIDS